MGQLKFGDPGYMEEDVSPRLYAITFSVLGAAILVVSLRLFSRFYLLRGRRLTPSESLIIAAVVLDVASCGLIHGQIVTGMGRHIEYSRERPAMFVKSMQVGLAQNTVYQCLIGVIKTSILAQYCTFALPGVERRVVLGITGFVVLFTVFTTFSAIFQCIPVSAAWNLDTFPKGCWNMMGMNFFTSGMNTFLDLVIFVLPIPTIAKLHMEKKKKFTLTVGFSVGLFAIACSLIRLRNIVYFNGEGDFTYAASMVPIWGAIECNAGIVCGEHLEPHRSAIF
ncbi:hypothetical protein FB567DRAFT_41408 [Paraphoma chrysanthemicola]|uniref:Rhodopsin domain-containing protein n=1 Tax=Paraphoma chrysanthemicola TaxID=798071 RepID=A0A8K0RL57_9PLEO|nr:hypothetical protein FB567DRAFT_41408 [Paraphoma chrysanthemicola]